LIISVHQPNFLPWSGYFHKINVSDRFVFLNSVQFSKGSYTNRCKIRSANGYQWLTVPIRKHSLETQICEIEIDNSKDWRKRHLDLLFSVYKDTPFYYEVFSFLESLYGFDSTTLDIMNRYFIIAMCDFLQIKCEFFTSKSLADNNLSRESLVTNLVKKLEGSIYFAGQGSKEYQQDDLFEKNQIEVVYSLWNEDSVYKDPELKGIGLSIIDSLFYSGPSNLRNVFSNKKYWRW